MSKLRQGHFGLGCEDPGRGPWSGRRRPGQHIGLYLLHLGHDGKAQRSDGHLAEHNQERSDATRGSWPYYKLLGAPCTTTRSKDAVHRFANALSNLSIETVCSFSDSGGEQRLGALSKDWHDLADSCRFRDTSAAFNFLIGLKTLSSEATDRMFSEVLR